jgi:Cof subfamily protein (haloacid dehalogenase superfamily)
MPNERFLIGVEMKYIFIDFDGTIMNSHTGQIPQSTYDTIKELQNQGHQVIITTGRNLYLLEDYPKRLNINWVSGSNGRFLSKDLVTLDYEDPIPKQAVLDLIRDLKAHRIDYVLSTHDAYVTHQKFGPSIDLFSEHFKMQYPQIIETFEDYDHIFQINVFSDQEIPQEILNTTPLSFLRASHHGFDVTMGNTLKEKTLEYVRSKYDVKREDIIAIGDGLNDMGMIQYAGFGIAMGNASNEVKAVANYVTETIDNEGLYQAFKYMRLVE